MLLAVLIIGVMVTAFGILASVKVEKNLRILGVVLYKILPALAGFLLILHAMTELGWL
jgi:hypothetical protein